MDIKKMGRIKFLPIAGFGFILSLVCMGTAFAINWNEPSCPQDYCWTDNLSDTPGTTSSVRIKALHFQELNDAIADARTQCGAVYASTLPNVVSGGIAVASDINAIRNAVREIYTQEGISDPTSVGVASGNTVFGSDVSSGQTILKTHISDLRSAITKVTLACISGGGWGVCNNNTIQDNGETGPDCGGGGCAACPTGPGGTKKCYYVDSGTGNLVWYDCSATCGNWKLEPGEECEKNWGPLGDCPNACNASCQINDCGAGPRDGGWTWWGQCSVSCGGDGVMTRTCDNPPPINGGSFCQGADTQPCNNGPCGAVDGGWCDWGVCEGEIGQMGTQTRYCSCPSPSNGGAFCVGESTRSCICKIE